jgi:parallel beta-helix repeat protein
VHDNVDKTPPLVIGDTAGIELVTAHVTDVSQNVVHHNGDGGIQLRVASTQNTIRHNHVSENGIQRLADLGAAGILVTGAGTHDNRIEHNEILANYGRGIMLCRPAGMAPITGNLVAHNRLHGNHRSGVAIMNAGTGNFVMHNDARDNNLSGLAPCYKCNLFDLSIGGNIWEKNQGTFNGIDACAP